MSPEMISIIGVGIGLAVLNFGLIAWLRADITRLEDRIRQETREREERIVVALAGHRHPQADAEPVFTQPV